MALARQDYGSKNGGVTALPGTYGSNAKSVGAGNQIGSGAPSYLRINSSGKVTDTRDFSYTPTPKPVAPRNDSGGGGNSGGGGYSAPSYSGGTDDIVNQIKALLQTQQEQANKYYQTLYEQQVAKNNQDWEADRNQINRNFMRGRNYLNQLYGDSSTGPGISNQARNYQNWQSNLASARQNRTNNDATALSQLNMNKANTASQLAQGWYNYVLPVYTNRQQTLDDYDYRRYLASL